MTCFVEAPRRLEGERAFFFDLNMKRRLCGSMLKEYLEMRCDELDHGRSNPSGRAVL